MPAHIDLQARRITFSVGALLGEAESRAIGLTGTGLSRMWIGQELHRRVQHELAQVDDGFEAEVPVHADLDIDGWQVSISGRAASLLLLGGLIGAAVGEFFTGARTAILVAAIPDAGSLVYPGILALLIVSGLLATLVPIRRALAIKPSEALASG